MTIPKQRTKVMIAGIGGASLGTEIGKCLQLANKYEIYGCDISTTAYGLYENGFTETFCVKSNDYVTEVLKTCNKKGIKWLIPGGEQPNILLGAAAVKFAQEGISVVTNNTDTVSLFSDKEATFNKLKACGVPIPKTSKFNTVTDILEVGLPCIVKPATGSGGSSAVFFAVTTDEALIYAEYIRHNGNVPIVQEYVRDDEGEFSIGVLSLPDKTVVGSIALRRVLNAKLSVSYRGQGGVISSGYSQGYIDTFPDLCIQAERIANLIESRGPINIQGRVRNGMLIPFEINPRFSASTYLRALAGFNEIDMFLDYLINAQIPLLSSIKTGWYLRSLTENYVSKEDIK